MDLRYLERWTAARRKPALRQMGVDEIHLGKQQKFITVVSNLETAEPLWFGRERKKETLDQFFQDHLSLGQRRRIEAACVDMWEAYRQSIEEWAPRCRIVYDKFHILQHANAAVDEVRRNLDSQHRGELNRLFQLNRRVFKAYLLKESLERLWDYRYEGAMLNYLQKWMDQLKWQRLRPFEKLADMLLNHLEGILNYCRMKVPMGVVESVNGNIKSLLRPGRGYSNLRYLLLKVQRMAVTKTEFVVFRKAA
jgi:transposase